MKEVDFTDSFYINSGLQNKIDILIGAIIIEILTWLGNYLLVICIITTLGYIKKRSSGFKKYIKL
jgi:hypothetical protein